MDAAHDDDVPEWGRDYGAPKGSGRRARADSYGSSGYGGSVGRANGGGSAGGYGGGSNGNNATPVGAKNKQGQENWDHQF